MRIEPRVPEAVLERMRAPLLRGSVVRVDPPVIQPLDLLLDLSGEAMRERLFVVQGEGAEEACLRPDFTMAVARQVVEEGAGEGRRYYQGQAFRIPPPGAADRHPAEFLQIGLEVFGGPRDGALDAELAALAWEAAKAGGRRDLSLRIGDVRFFKGFLSDIGVAEPIAARLRRAFTRPRRLKAELARASRTAPPISAFDAVEVARQWAERGLEPVGGRSAEEIADRLARRQMEDALPRLTDGQVSRIETYLTISGPPEEAFRQLGDVTHGDAFNRESRWWSLLIDQLPSLGVPESRITFDAGFAGPFGYYDGLVFEILSAQLGADAAVAAGGRYDSLLSQLSGRSIRAAGLMVRPFRAWTGDGE
jgi:ATP phosphoribosyltransferase regulatory subunit